jgi:hypothetical protein
MTVLTVGSLIKLCADIALMALALASDRSHRLAPETIVSQATGLKGTT